MVFQWFLSLLLCLLCDWPCTSGDESLKEINGTKLLDPMTKKNRVSETTALWIAAGFSNNTNDTVVVTSQKPLQHAASSASVVRAAQMVSVQTSTRQVGLSLAANQNPKQGRHSMQASDEFGAYPSTLQAFVRVDEFNESEDTHFLYYIVVFGVVIVCIYIASHNKKKILGFIIEGRRPSNSARRTALRYRRLSQHDDNVSDPASVIY
ncbi:unnamed protein product [Litomosoides sigmodontis]|uniref:Uncharacterized protein n=1 Tax=Litomosoides sigmodontis TaxID=42156 RepID=A0A3P6UYB5_LITSI|nr:unnamed protein product [Litomosoides sigmodontis]